MAASTNETANKLKISHEARASPLSQGTKAQEMLEKARAEPKPEWEVAEQVVRIPLEQLKPFKNHPFKVGDDDELMQDTIDSIMAGGIINPILVRPTDDGKFEVISGHRRFRASELAGKADIKAIVRDMDDDTAVITMVDSNLQRETISPMERAQAYKMKLEALKHQGKRADLTCAQVGHKLNPLKSVQQIAEDAGESKTQVQRYIRLTELQPELRLSDYKFRAVYRERNLRSTESRNAGRGSDRNDYHQQDRRISQRRVFARRRSRAGRQCV